MDHDAVLTTLRQAADAVIAALRGDVDWRASGEREGQYAVDLVADRAAVSVLTAAGFGVLSEESGWTNEDAEIWVVLDPLDGSTNASRGIPHYAVSMCACAGGEMEVALVLDMARNVEYTAVRGGGAFRDGMPIATSGCDQLNHAIVGMTGYPPEHYGWAQFRAMGAAALDLCAVADGTLDAFAVVGDSSLGVWDYLGAALVCKEAGATIHDDQWRELATRQVAARRAIIASATITLQRELTQRMGGSVSPAGI